MEEKYKFHTWNSHNYRTHLLEIIWKICQNILYELSLLFHSYRHHREKNYFITLSHSEQGELEGGRIRFQYLEVLCQLTLIELCMLSILL